MYAILDVETGGFSLEKNGICEVAMIILDKDFKELARHESYIKPYTRPNSLELVSYKESAMNVNKINVDVLHSAPEASEVIKTLEDLILKHGVTTMVGHNASFDIKRFEYLSLRFGRNFKITRSVCTMQKTKRIYPALANHQLATVCKRLQIVNNNPHRAMGDTEATMHVFLKTLRS